MAGNDLLCEIQYRVLRYVNRFDGNYHQWRKYLDKIVYSLCIAVAEDTYFGSVISLHDDITLPNGDKTTLEQVLTEIIDPSEGAEAELIAEEEQLEKEGEAKALIRGLKMISKRCQKLIGLSQNGLTHREIAPLIGLIKKGSEKQIGKHLRQCYDSLFKKILYLYTFDQEASIKLQAISRKL